MELLFCVFDVGYYVGYFVRDYMCLFFYVEWLLCGDLGI